MDNLLDNLYAYNATIPSMVYFVRKLSEGKAPVNEVKQTFEELVDILCGMPFVDLEKKNKQFIRDSNKSDFLNKKRNKVSQQLDQISKLDQQLTTAIIAMEDKIQHLEMLKNRANMYSNEHVQTENVFQSLFSSSSSETLFDFPIPVLERQTAIVESDLPDPNHLDLHFE